MEKFPLFVLPKPGTREYVWVSPESLSIGLNTPTRVGVFLFSVTSILLNEIPVGGPLTSRIVIINSRSKKHALESVVLTLML